MSLFSSIRLASNALRADEIALQVVGQNIANANTPGYIREEVVLVPSDTQQIGNLLLGTGVKIQAVVQVVDYFLEDRLRSAVSDTAYYQSQSDVYLELETLIGELSSTDISTNLSDFCSAISEILSDPTDVSLRNLAVLQGEQLTETINYLANNVLKMRQDVNDQIENIASEINRLVEKIRRLNIEIAQTEGGSSSNSDAVGLRDQRLVALTDLAKLIDIQVEEQVNGAVVVYCNDTYLVYGGTSRSVKVESTSVNGLFTAEISIAETNAPLKTNSGELSGLIVARDKILDGFFEQLNDFAATLIYEFNKVYASGQGLAGYEQLTSAYAVLDTTSALNKAGLEFTPTNGSFQISVFDEKAGVTKTTDLYIKLNGNPSDTTLNSLLADLNAIDGLTASLSATGFLQIEAASGKEFYFSHDTSGVLAALGLNVFFTGTSATNIGVSSVVAKDPSLFAASQGGLGNDTQNATILADFADYPLASMSRKTIAGIYEDMIARVTQGASIAQSSCDAASVFEETLFSEKLAVSGVSIDEETVNLLAFQRAYQAAAKYIAALDELLQILMNL
mgnify:FL=1